MTSLYDSVRASVDQSTTASERVEVNQRALIDKILARYASAGAVYRELLQNSNDAEATVAEVHFTVSKSVTASGSATNSMATTDNSTTGAATGTSNRKAPIVTSVMYRNNGWPFRKQDWSRLKKIAEGNPDEVRRFSISRMDAFGGGRRSLFVAVSFIDEDSSFVVSIL